MSLAHQHIVARINRIAEIERENQIMAEIERRATPLFYAVMAVVSIVALWIATAGYRDVIQHKLDTMAERQQAERISQTLASCANGAVVSFDGALMTCKVKPLELVSLK